MPEPDGELLWLLSKSTDRLPMADRADNGLEIRAAGEFIGLPAGELLLTLR